MPDRYVPPAAIAAMTRAQQERARYQQARSAVRKDKTTNRGQKRRELDRLQEVYRQRQQDHLAAYRHAYDKAEWDALLKLMRPKAVNRWHHDSYIQHFHRLRDASILDLETELSLAEVLGDNLLGQVVATIAWRRRTPLPGDKATQLVERFVNWRLPNGGLENPDASIGYERLIGLERTPADVMAETSVFSVSSTPEPVEESNIQPVHPRDAAAAKIAELYPDNGQVTSEPPPAAS